jgi:hypothetical protein
MMVHSFCQKTKPMNQPRRQFFSSMGASALSVPALAGLAMANQAACQCGDAIKKEFMEITQGITQELNKVSSVMAQKNAVLNQRMNIVEMQMWGQKAKLQFVFLLLLLSFCIDGGLMLSALL